MKPKVAIIGTSWWADAMYLPALTHDGSVDVVAVAGRNPERTQAFADQWSIPRSSTDAEQLISDVDADAVVIASPNDTHFRLTNLVLDRGLAVLTEKPIGLTYPEAAALADRAESLGVTTMTPFTYSFIPTSRYVKQLIDDGYIGTPYHMNLRYYANYGRDGDYAWRFDADRAGSGVAGDLGSHFAYLALWYFGEIATVTSTSSALIERPHPDGEPYRQAEDTSIMTLDFANGALGSITVMCMAHEPGPISQTFGMDFHGSDGTLHVTVDWDTRQTIIGARSEDSAPSELSIPRPILGDSDADDVIASYKNTFRRDGLMVREFAHAALRGEPVRPDLRAGADVQRVIDAALLSHSDGQRIAVTDILA